MENIKILKVEFVVKLDIQSFRSSDSCLTSSTSIPAQFLYRIIVSLEILFDRLFGVYYCRGSRGLLSTNLVLLPLRLRLFFLGRNETLG